MKLEYDHAQPDVIKAVGFASEEDLVLALRSGTLEEKRRAVATLLAISIRSKLSSKQADPLDYLIYRNASAKTVSELAEYIEYVLLMDLSETELLSLVSSIRVVISKDENVGRAWISSPVIN